MSAGLLNRFGMNTVCHIPPTIPRLWKSKVAHYPGATLPPLSLAPTRTLESNQPPRFNSGKSAIKQTKMATVGVDWPDAPRFTLESSYEKNLCCLAVAYCNGSLGPVWSAQRRHRARAERDHHTQSNYGSSRPRHP